MSVHIYEAIFIIYENISPEMSVYIYGAIWYHFLEYSLRISGNIYESILYDIPECFLECRYTPMRLHDIISQNGPWDVGIHLRDYMISYPKMVRGKCQCTSISLHHNTSKKCPCNIGIHLWGYMLSFPRMALVLSGYIYEATSYHNPKISWKFTYEVAWLHIPEWSHDKSYIYVTYDLTWYQFAEFSLRISVYIYEFTWFHIPEWSLECRHISTRLHDNIPEWVSGFIY